MSEEFHEDNIRLCERAARVLRVDIAGIDLLIPDHRASWKEVGGVICEVNAQPQIGLTYPEIYPYLLKAFVEDEGRIPISLVLTDDAQTGRAIMQRFEAAVETSGLRLVEEGVLQAQNQRGALLQNTRAALIDPDCTALLILSAGAEFNRLGLPVDRLNHLWVPAWRGTAAHLRARLEAVLPHLAPGEILLDETLQHLLKSEYISPAHPVCRQDRQSAETTLLRQLGCFAQQGVNA